VVGRVGRIGHGELKGWSWLLSRKALLKASKHLKEICGQCSLLYPSAAPCVLSACLVSLEPDSTLRLMADQFTPDERFSQASVNCQLSTPQDVTCTHILVFPTSATTQVKNYLSHGTCCRISFFLFKNSFFDNNSMRFLIERCRCPSVPFHDITILS
jgi:mediator of RNA polymerase II transcription subunit 13